MNKITLQGLRDLYTDDSIKPQTDYGLFIVASRVSEEKMDDDTGLKFRMKFERIDQIFDLKEKRPIEFQKGKSPSQTQRWRITEKLGEEEYEPFMKYLLSRMEELTDDYIELNKK